MWPKNFFSNRNPVSTLISFRNDFERGNGIDDFMNDLLRKEKNRINCLPGIILKNKSGKGVVILGYHPYDLLENIFMDFLGKTENEPA